MLKQTNKNLYLGLALFAASFSRAQVVSAATIMDAKLRSLQVEYNRELTEIGSDVRAANFDYPFYLSATLGLDQVQQQRDTQRSLRFERYEERTVLAVSGNYFAAYSGDKMNGELRARESFLKVVLPILKAAVPRFQSIQDVQGYAVEISHHVAGSAMGVAVEQSENLMVFLPQADAIRLIASADVNVQQSALLNGKAFLNGEPISIWLNSGVPRPPDPHPPATPSASTVAETVHHPSRDNSTDASRDISTPALEKLRASREQTVVQLVRDLDSQAHFISYAPQNFVTFRGRIYLELSLRTQLDPNMTGSRYKIAATAFDEHIASLVRPATAYFENESDFDGISFSTTVTSGSTGNDGNPKAVEFFFPFPLLRCYKQYDCTGQQLIDGSAVLVNGERISLDLQAAERF